VTFAGATVAGSFDFTASTSCDGGAEGQMFSQDRVCADGPGSGQRQDHGQWKHQQ
jgi:hypothetical protein